MERSEGRFTGYGGLQLYRQSWRPEGPSRSCVALVHGFGEHSGRYPAVVRGLTGSGFAVHSFDHRGHGRSPGQRGHVLCWEEYRQDVASFLGCLRSESPGIPIFLMGHSMGGLIVLDFGLRHPEGLRGVVASGPAIRPGQVANPVLVLAAKVLSRVWPSFSLSMGMDSSLLSRDPAEQQRYERDPLVHCRASARWGTECLDTGRWVGAHAGAWALPLLIVHGGADKVCDPAGSQSFVEAVPIQDKTLFVYPESRHEPHNDLDRDRLVGDLCAWLERHL